MRPQYFYECRDAAPYVGDYLGQPAVTRWVVRGHGCAEGKGPFQWFHQYYRSVMWHFHQKIYKNSAMLGVLQAMTFLAWTKTRPC